MGLGSDILPCTYVEISASHISLGSVILPCTSAEIRNNRTGLGSAILVHMFGLSHSSWSICRNQE
jgi:hypothetical protein